MSLGPGEVMTPAQCLNNDQHLHRCQQVRWGSHHRVTIISFLICQHCAMISDDAPTGYCKSSLWFIGQQFSVALGCGLIDSSVIPLAGHRCEPSITPAPQCPRHNGCHHQALSWYWTDCPLSHFNKATILFKLLRRFVTQPLGTLTAFLLLSCVFSFVLFLLFNNI